MSAVSDAVTLFRAEWATQFVDSCTIDRTTGRGTFNTTTGGYDAPTNAQQYSGACRIRPMGEGESEKLFGQQQITEKVYTVELPYTVTSIQPDDLLTVTASTLDTSLVGVVLRVVGYGRSSYLTHRHVVAVENLGAGTP